VSAIVTSAGTLERRGSGCLRIWSANFGVWQSSVFISFKVGSLRDHSGRKAAAHVIWQMVTFSFDSL